MEKVTHEESDARQAEEEAENEAGSTSMMKDLPEEEQRQLEVCSS